MLYVPINDWPITAGESILSIPAFIFKKPYTGEGQVEIKNKTTQIPIMGEVWDIEAIILNLLVEYEVKAYFNIDERVKNIESQLKQLELIEKHLRTKQEFLENVHKKQVEKSEEIPAEQTLAEIQGILVELEGIIGESHKIENENKVLGKQETQEIVADDWVALKLQLEFPTTLPFFISQEPSFTRQQISAQPFNQLSVSGTKFAEQSVIVRERFTGRVDLNNPVQQIQLQNVIASIGAIVPPRSEVVEPKSREGAPYINNLKIAVNTFTLQCSQTQSLAKSIGQ